MGEQTDNLQKELRNLLILNQYSDLNITNVIGGYDSFMTEVNNFYKFYNHMYNDKSRTSSLYNLTLYPQNTRKLRTPASIRHSKQDFNDEIKLLRKYLAGALKVVDYDNIDLILKDLELTVHVFTESYERDYDYILFHLNNLTEMFNINITDILKGY